MLSGSSASGSSGGYAPYPASGSSQPIVIHVHTNIARRQLLLPADLIVAAHNIDGQQAAETIVKHIPGSVRLYTR